MAELEPEVAPPQRDVVTTLSAAGPAGEPTPPPLALSALPSVLPPRNGSPANLGRPNAPVLKRASLPQRREEADAVEPLTADLRRLHVTVDREFLELLDAARDALSHSNPGATTNEILKKGMKSILAQDAKKKGVVGATALATAPASPS